MTLLWIIAVPVLGGLLAGIGGRVRPPLARWIALGALGIDLMLGIGLCGEYARWTSSDAGGRWLEEIRWEWIPSAGIAFHLGVDGLSLPLMLLTIFLGIMAVIASWNGITERVGFFHFNLLWVLSGILGVFLALDLFLFFFCWELMLVPMYFLIAIWGHERRHYAAIKFFLFTQGSGLLMLLAILGLYFSHGRQMGDYTFAYSALLETDLSGAAALWLMLGFFVAFAVKLPAFPFHPWLADAHTEAPTAGSVVLAGLLLKTGAYGLIRFVVPIFGETALDFAPVAMALGVIGILYGATLAFAQTDLKRLIAYSSISHMGFVLLGVFAWNPLALQGVVMQMICHGISTGALFILAGELQDRIHTREMDRMGGFWTKVPRMAGVGLFFALASLGLPGLGNFVAEFLILLGSFRASVILTAFAACGLVAAVVYALWMVQRVFHGEERESWKLPDFAFREMGMMSVLIAAIVWLGLHPQPVFNAVKPALETLQHDAAAEPLSARWRNGSAVVPDLLRGSAAQPMSR
jgi:NADH-quinone oxidoreductase subunit M